MCACVCVCFFMVFFWSVFYDIAALHLLVIVFSKGMLRVCVFLCVCFVSYCLFGLVYMKLWYGVC